MRRKVNWVLDADIRDFFSTLDRAWLERFLEHRIADTRVLRLIQKWVNAGVIENGEWSDTGRGTAQGASVSPVLGNVYLHYVFDLWAQSWRRGRFATFGLELAEDKTRLIEFGRFAAERRARRGLGKPETFQFLGFTHICARTRSGRFQLKRITDAKRMRAKLRAVKTELWRRMHLPIPEQGRWLASVVRGHCAYYAVPGNSKAVAAFRDQVTWLWYRSLRRRSQRTSLNWEGMHRLATRWLPSVRIQHLWPVVRFDART